MSAQRLPRVYPGNMKTGEEAEASALRKARAYTGDQRIQAIRELREEFQLGLKETKELYDAAREYVAAHESNALLRARIAELERELAAAKANAGVTKSDVTFFRDQYHFAEERLANANKRLMGQDRQIACLKQIAIMLLSDEG